MKCAVLLSGEIRDGLKYLDQNFNFFLKNNDVDVYIHSYRCDEEDQITKFYKPKWAIFEVKKQYVKQELIDFVSSNKAGETVPYNALHMWRKRKEVFKLIEKYNYDKIFLTRFDSYGDKNISNYFDKSSLVIPQGGDFRGGIFDLCCLGSYEQLKYYCDLYDFAETYSKEGCLFHPETMLKYHLDKNKDIIIERVPINIYLRDSLFTCH